VERGGANGSTLSHLEGSLSGRSHDAETLIGLDPGDQRPLLARYDLVAAARSLTRESIAARRSGGLWRWREVLPVRDARFITYLGEGDTPLQPVPAFGLANLLVKRESLNPTGSFKARGMAVAVSRAVELGARLLVAPSAGNAGGALAAYAAAAGVPAIVIMPGDSPAINQVEVLATGAQMVLLDGLISDCGRLAAMIRDELGAFDLSTLKEPYRIEGKKTMGFELAAQLGWRLPDAIVYPTGGGTGLVGMWKAFEELEALGLVGPARPRMFSVQAAGCAPIVRAFEAGERFAAAWEGAATAAAGLRVPSAVGDFLILEAIRASGGAAVAVPEPEIVTTRALLGAMGLGYASLETAAAIAGLGTLVESGRVSRGETVVLFDTGAGFKSDPPSFAGAAVVPNDPAYWRERVVPGLR
jgi:threonine synthase